MITQDVARLRGMELHGRDGDKIGTIEAIYLDTDTNEPEWMLVQSGLFGTKRTFVPLREAQTEDDHVTVPYLAGEAERRRQAADERRRAGEQERERAEEQAERARRVDPDG